MSKTTAKLNQLTSAVVALIAVLMILTPAAQGQKTGKCEPGYRLEGHPKVCTLYYINQTIDAQGNLIVVDTDTNTIRQISPSGVVTTILNNANGNGPRATGGYSPSGTLALQANTSIPRRPVLDQTGNIYFAAQTTNTVHMINVDGQSHFGIPMNPGNLYTIGGTTARGYSGDGGPATKAQFYQPEALTLDLAGNVYIPDFSNNAIRMINADGLPHFGQSMVNGSVYTIAGGTRTSTGAPDCGFAGDGGPATSAWLNLPVAVAIDSHGNVFFSDAVNNMIRRVDAMTGIITHVAGALTDDSGNTLEGWHSCGVANQLPPQYPPNDGLSGDGGLAIHARLNIPYTLTFDRFDNLYFEDRTNNVIRKIEAKTGIITTVVGQGGSWVTVGTGNITSKQTQFMQAGLDAHGQMSSLPGFEIFNMGNLLTAAPVHPSAKCVLSRAASAISDMPVGWPQNHLFSFSFYQITNDSTGAGALRSWSYASFCEAQFGTMVDIGMTSGNAASATATMDSGIVNPWEYRILPDGTQTSVVWSGDGGLATEALLNGPAYTSVDMDFNIYFYDTGAFRYRMVPASDGTYFGIPMLAGHIYTIAGDGHLGFWTGDGPALSVSF